MIDHVEKPWIEDTSQNVVISSKVQPVNQNGPV